MLDDIFYLVLNMSLAGSFIIAVLLIIRLIKLLPRRIVYPLWLLAFFRLVFPFTFSTHLSLFNFTGRLVKRLVTIEVIIQDSSSLPSNMSVMNFIGAADSYVPFEYKAESLRKIFTTASIIWIIVTTAALIATIILYSLTHAELNKAVVIRDNIYRSDMLLTPVLVGVIRSKVILPPSLDPDSVDGKMVLIHENIHRKRFDNLWRTIAIFIACIHWFNPLVWVMLKAFFTDMEQSCDEAVMRKGSYNAEERRAYASALLRFAEDKRILISTAFGHSGIKVRIVNVLNYKRMTVIGEITSFVFLLSVAIVLITNPALRR